MKVSGNLVMLMGKENFFILMVMSTLGNGSIIRQMVMESMKMQKERIIKDNGKMINSTVKASKCGTKVQNTRVLMSWEKRKAMESILGLINQPTKESGSITV